ncbi:MAG: hypothetical protein INR64_08590 [Caulobacteraceae bacterium]|nr:hypothetical protein [Caulobacter sp.]
MRLEIDRAAASRLKAARLLQLARGADEPHRSDLVRLAEDHAREAWTLKAAVNAPQR